MPTLEKPVSSHTVFHIRIGGHSPVRVSDAKINLPGWKLTHPDEQIAFIDITDENKIYILFNLLFIYLVLMFYII